MTTSPGRHSSPSSANRRLVPPTEPVVRLFDGEPRALEVARPQGGEAPVLPEDRLALSEHGRLERAAGRGQGAAERRTLANGRDAKVDDLDRIAEGVPVLLLVQAVE